MIVGAGVTGICLAHELMLQGVDVMVMDNGKNVSSIVSAGMITPLVFRRMTLSWRVDDMLPFARNTYKQLEEQIGETCYHELPLRRLFASEQELEFWKDKQYLDSFCDYMEPLNEDDLHFPLEQNTFGTGRVKQAAYVDTTTFIQGFKRILKQENRLMEENFEFQHLDASGCTYRQESFDLIVFADGKDVKYNPLFGHLPMQPTKGELLTIQSDSIYNKESLNRKCFLLPLENNTFKVGSTYIWDVDDTEITEEGRTTIAENLQSITKETYTIINQQAGVRPTVPDRRPILGRHPEFPKMVIANGMGAKGYLIAPLLMHELANHLLHGEQLDPETNINRF